MNNPDKPSNPDPVAMRAIEQSVEHWGNTREESLVLGFIAGGVATVVCAIGWAVFTIGTGIQLGLLAIVLGMIVGAAVRFGGNSWDSKFGVMAAVLALGGCVLGNYLTVIMIVSQMEEGMAYLDVVLALGLGGSAGAMIASFGIMDILFYVIAVSAAYRMGFRA